MFYVLLLSLAACAEPAAEAVVDADVDVSVEADVEAPPAAEPPDWEDVLTEMREALPAEWAEVPDGRIVDVATGIMRLSKTQARDPIIMADEVVEIIEIVTALQPAFQRGWEGGLPRAAFTAWSFYRAEQEIATLHCSQLSDSFATFTVDDPEVPRPRAHHLAGMAYRESSFALRTERGYDERRVGKRIIKTTECRGCRGLRGEQGMFQAMPGKGGSPGACARRFLPEGCSPFDPWCAAQMAMRALAVYRCECIAAHGSRCTVDSFIASYGVTRLVAPENAMYYRGNDRARQLLCAVYEDCDEIWPRAFSFDMQL